MIAHLPICCPLMDLNETIDQLPMVSSVCCNGHVLRREDGHVWKRTLDFEVERQRKKGFPKRTWKNILRLVSLLYR